MRCAFERPPSSVQEACDQFLQQKGVGPGDPAAEVLQEAVAFGQVTAMGRTLASVPADATQCNAQDARSRVLQVSTQVLAEAAQLSAGPAKH